MAQIIARHSSPRACTISSQEFSGLEPSIFLAKAALVMLTINLWPSVGLCNGSTGTVIDIIYSSEHQPPLLPIAVIVNFDNYSGPSITTIPNCVPISPITITVNLAGTVHERQQVPLKLAWAHTIHNSQGLTLKKSWVDIGKKENTFGITYVAISRVKSLSSLVIEPMSFERLTSIKNSEALTFRKKEEYRLKQLSEQTIACQSMN